MQTLILGGGLAGLGCAHRLDAAGAKWRLLEREARVGGLARSETRDGFTFDATGHWLHLRDPKVKALVLDLLGEDALWVSRSAWIHTHGMMVPYPFQTHTGALPPEVTYECLMGFIRARFGEEGRALREREPASFEDFVLRNLGEGIGRHFMFPYNRKLYQVDLSELSAAWTGRFVPNPSVEDVVRGAVGAKTETQGYNARFVYPRSGGIETLSRRLAARLQGEIHTGATVVAVDPKRRCVRTQDGTEHPYTQLVSTLPLPALIEICEGVPETVRRAARRLRAVSVTYVNVAVRVGEGTPPLDYHWVYFPEPEFPFYRAGCASAAVPDLAPPGCRTFYVEFSHLGPGLSEETYCVQALEGLARCGLLREADEVLFTFARTIPTAYVLFDRAYEESRATVFAWLEALGIRSIGRYGAWEYSSMEDALIAGRTAAEALLS
ncbi:MAG: amine oxidase [Deltaproteobacteria bacterium]|nr:MAG: amine oxidase [Deltaproteobacteria bacterium]